MRNKRVLLIMGDDGISAAVWLLHARAWLRQGATVMAITDKRNEHNAVGVGDGLPAYGRTLTSNPSFINRKVDLSDADALYDEVQRLPPDAVLLWNMSIFEWAVADPRWARLLKGLQALPHTMVFVHETSGMWLHGAHTPELHHLERVQWDYVAGYEVINACNQARVLSLFPLLAPHLRGLLSSKRQPFAMQWQVASRDGRSLCLQDSLSRLAVSDELAGSLASVVPVQVDSVEEACPVVEAQPMAHKGWWDAILTKVFHS